MNRKKLITRIIAGVFYAGGFLFALYIAMIILSGNSFFDLRDLLVCASGVCVPIVIGTIMLMSSIQETDKKYKAVRWFLWCIFIFYILLLLGILFRNAIRCHPAILTGISFADHIKWSTNIIPFRTIVEYIQAFFDDSMNKSIIFYNLIGNLLLFAPMGILLPCVFTKLRTFGKFTIGILIILFSVEIVQLLTLSGSCDIDDVILNLFGAVLFYGIWNLKLTQKILNKIYVLKY